MELTAPIAKEISAKLSGRPLGELENSWRDQKLTYKKELHELFHAASVVRYMRMGITPKWVGDERLLAKCLALVPGEDA